MNINIYYNNNGVSLQEIIEKLLLEYYKKEACN